MASSLAILGTSPKCVGNVTLTFHLWDFFWGGGRSFASGAQEAPETLLELTDSCKDLTDARHYRVTAVVFGD